MAEKDTWPTKQDAARNLGLSLRSIERLITEKKIRITHKRVPGRKALTCCHPDDIAKLKASIVPSSPVPAPGKNNGTLPAPKQAAHLPTALQQFAAAFLGTVPYPPRTLFLSLREAAEYSGLPKSALKELITKGEIKVRQRGKRVWVSRKALEALE